MRAMRSLLFVPGDSARKFEKARVSGADALILDLEDSVAPEAKSDARKSVQAMLGQRAQGQIIFVRVNALATGLASGGSRRGRRKMRRNHAAQVFRRRRCGPAELLP